MEIHDEGDISVVLITDYFNEYLFMHELLQPIYDEVFEDQEIASIKGMVMNKEWFDDFLKKNPNPRQEENGTLRLVAALSKNKLRNKVRIETSPEVDAENIARFLNI